MGVAVTPLTKWQWLLAFVCVGLGSMIGAFLWQVLFSLLSPTFTRLLVMGSLLGFCAGVVGFLMWLRLMLAHMFWLKIWIIASPLLLSSLLFLPLPPILSLLLLWCFSILF